MLQDVADLAIRIEKIAEHPGPGRTGFHARRLASFAGALRAEMALFHHALHPRTVTDVVGVGIEFLGRNLGLCPIEMSSPIRGHAAIHMRHPIHQL